MSKAANSSTPVKSTGEHMQPPSHQSGERVLLPQDRGYVAWSFLCAAATVGAVTWSIPWSFGILIKEYLRLPEIASQPNASKLIPLIGTLPSGIIYCSSPLVYPYMSLHRTHTRPLMWLGMNLCWISLLIASYCRTVYGYIIFQGVLYGVGGGLVTPPCVLYMFEWFSKRRGLANGILNAGMAFGCFVLPIVLPPLVRAYGLHSTLRITAIATLILLFPSLMFVRPRLPAQQLQVHHCSILAITTLSIRLRNWIWWTLVTANVFQGFALFVPFNYIPTFASALNIDSTLTSLAMVLLNVSFAIGPVFVGLLSDYFAPWPLAFIFFILSALSTVVFWGAIGGIVGVMLFCVTYGFVAGTWRTLWASFVSKISHEDALLSMSIYGTLMLTRGLGIVLSTPISTALASVESISAGDGGSRQGFVLDGRRFARLIGYIVACFMAATLVSVVGWRLEKATTKDVPSTADESALEVKVCSVRHPVKGIGGDQDSALERAEVA